MTGRRVVRQLLAAPQKLQERGAKAFFRAPAWAVGLHA